MTDEALARADVAGRHALRATALRDAAPRAPAHRAQVRELACALVLVVVIVELARLLLA